MKKRMWKMQHKIRSKTTELIILEFLKKRISLSTKVQKHYSNLIKGYKGELRFDRILENRLSNCLILNDLLLEVNNTTFQIDSLIINQGKVFLYEIKNYEGDYYYQADKLFKRPQLEIINPLHQLSRSESLLKNLLLQLGSTPQIKSFVVFINPCFTLYQAPLDTPFIFPTQLQHHLQSFNNSAVKITEGDRRLANKLLSAHKTVSPYSLVPSYDYDSLRKGITCLRCNFFFITVKHSKCICDKCGYIEETSAAVLRAIKEYKILFPNNKITTNIIYDWCQIIPSRKTIRRILAKNFTAVGTGQWTYYT